MELIRYSINEAEIAKMSDIYMGLTVKSLDDEEGLAAVHSARMVVVKHRTSIDKLRKSSNEDAQAFIKNNNNNAKKLLSLIEPIETHLKSEEGKIEAEKARIKAEADRVEKEKIQARVGALFAVNVILPFQDVALMSDADYKDKLILATDAYRTEQLRVAEEQAIKEEESKRLEQLAKEQAIESARLAKINEEQEAMAKAQAEREEALKEQERAIETAKRKEIERQEQIAWQAHESARLRILSEADAAEKVEREAMKKKEREEAEFAEKARAEALRPDREKLEQYAIGLTAIIGPDVKSKEAHKIIMAAEARLAEIADTIIKQARAM